MEFIMLENHENLDKTLHFIDNVLFNLSEMEMPESDEWQFNLKEARILISKVFNNNLFRKLVSEESLEYHKINKL